MDNIQKYTKSNKVGYDLVMSCIDKLHIETEYKVTISQDYIYIDDAYQRIMFSGNSYGQPDEVRVKKLFYLEKMLNEFLIKYMAIKQ